MKISTVIYTIGGVTAAVLTTYIITNTIRRKKITAKINGLIDGDIAATGTFADMRSDKAFDPNFYKNAPSNLITAQKAASYASIINTAIGDGDASEDDDKTIYNTLLNLRSKAQVSQVTEAYQRNYGGNLAEAIFDKMSNSWMCKGVLRGIGGFLTGGLVNKLYLDEKCEQGDTSTTSRLQAYIKALPKY